MNEGEGVNLGDYEPSWMTDGGGISGEQNQPDLDDYTPWDTTAWSRDNQQDDFTGGTGDASCTPSNPPESGTHFWGSIDGTCQWIDTNTCP